MSEFYNKVPIDLKANLQYRLELQKRCLRDEGFREAVRQACREDPLFFFQSFAVLYEPRPRYHNGARLPMTIPFIAWPHQRPIILGLHENLGKTDLGVEKSRGEGMSWLGVLLAVHNWIFIEGSKIGFVSSTMDKAHKAGDMDSLLEKAYWEIKHLPEWMVGKEDETGRDYNRQWCLKIAEHTLQHREYGSLISATAAVGGAGRGGRYSWYLMDELSEWDRGPDDRVMASTQQSTDCRLVIATPLGNEGAYYKFMHAPAGNLIKYVMDWKMNPTRNRGLYKMVRGKPVAIDPVNNPLFPLYDPPGKEVKDMWARLTSKGFRLDNKERSPWYDNECDRADSTPFSIAQELDRDYGGSMVKVFPGDFFLISESTVKEPFTRGEMHYNVDLEPTFTIRDDGPFKLWCPMNESVQPPPHQYIVSCDIATGTGGSYASNSVIQVIDLVLREQVAEYAINTMEPSDFCDLAIATCNWFHNAHLIWEINGVGAGFTARVKEQRYGNLYRMRALKGRSRAPTKNIGWHMNRESKNQLVSAFIYEVKSKGIAIRSRDLVRECGQYVRNAGRIEYVMSADDKAMGGEEHGDRAMAFGMAIQAMKSRPLARAEAQELLVTSKVEYGSLAWRQNQWEMQDQEKDPQDMEFWQLLESRSGSER